MDEKSENKQESKIQDPKSTILIVEDSEIQAVMLKRILIQNGYTVTWAKNGAEGLAAALKQRPTLIISDILMPVMDGYQMCREIKLQETLKDLPILLLTQLTEPEEVIRGLESGADNYITKPFNTNFLLSKVDALIKNPDQFKNTPNKRCIEFDYAGKHYAVHAGRSQTLGFLLSTYENAVFQNKELNKIQLELKALNELLEEKVKERTVALQESEERFRTIIESAKDAIICLKAPGTIYLWNKKAEEMFRYPASEAMGKDLHALVVPERYHEKAYQGIQDFFQTGEGPVVGKTIEMFALRKDGAEFPIELSISAMNINSRWQATGIIRDITERKHAEDNLQRSYEKLRRTLEETATALSSALEMRDAYTGGHGRRVTQLARAIASEMGLSGEQTDGTRIAGILHDIGKISIPAEILTKPAKLNKVEFELIKGHANAGYEILKVIEFPWPVAQIVLQHHEKMDGSGYPAGLLGDKILIEARILCVSDVIEAMASHRPYRAALGIDAAMEEITQKRGILYDPAVVDACVRLFKEKGFRFE